MELPISQLLSAKGLRLTKPRILVFETLKEAVHPLSVVDIIKRCPEIDAVSIYRTIDLFTKLAITTSVSHGWKQRYELAEPFQPHHHHIRCNQCEALTDIDWPELEQQIEAISRKYQFKITGHSFELNGVCDKCAIRQAT